MKKSDVNILIIDDDKSVREALLEVVKRRGYKAVAVAKPDEAESLVKIKPIHGVIVDVMLPGCNGVDLVLRLKENLMDGAGIIFISGIYKDKTFAADSLRKTDAIEYFLKPFDNEELITTLEQKLSEYIETPKVDLHSLLSSPFASNRERRKALDHVEDMLGYDLPFVFCILMDSESSGHLNIVDQDQNIYGVTFCKGALAKIDSENTGIFTKKLLLEHGFISDVELREVKSKSSSSDLAKNLVNEGLMSPHVPSLIKLETLTEELKKLVSSKKLKINFVPDRKIKPEPDNVDLQTITPLLHDMIQNQLELSWLKTFYSGWIGHPIRLGPQFVDHHQLVGLPLLQLAPGVIDNLKKEPTLEELITNCTDCSEDILYKVIHLLMLRRIVVFEEARRVKNIDEHVARLKSIHGELKGKNPIEIFQYFGLSDNPKTIEVTKIYKEFAKSHHPDTLPQAVSSEIRELNHELFSNVTAAFETLSNPEKKEKFFSEVKQKEAELQIKSDELITAAAIALTRGRYSEALPVLESAVNYYESERSLLHYWWGRFKVEGAMKMEEIPAIEKRFKAMSQGMKQTALWIFVSGLIKRYCGDYAGAENDFNKVLGLEPNFMDARRELTNLKSRKPVKVTAESILTGDLTDVVKALFKKNKGA